MNSITFDKLAYLEALKAGGFNDKQSHAADALDMALRQTVATKADILEVKHEIRASELRIIKWLVPALLGQSALIVALVKLL